MSKANEDAVFTFVAVVAFIAYATIAGFLCLAAIADVDLSDRDQWMWCAAAVGWGPLLLLIVLVLLWVF